MNGGWVRYQDRKGEYSKYYNRSCNSDLICCDYQNRSLTSQFFLLQIVILSDILCDYVA